jgi:hypothetical protein
MGKRKSQKKQLHSDSSCSDYDSSSDSSDGEAQLIAGRLEQADIAFGLGQR